MPSSSITNHAARGAPDPGALRVRAHDKENQFAPALVSQEERRPGTGRAASGAGRRRQHLDLHSTHQQAAPETGEAAKPKRRRGSRGGRNRRKPSTERRATATADGRRRASRRSGQRASAREACQAEATTGGAAARRPRRRQQQRRAPLPAAKRELLVSVDVTEKRVAVLEDDRVAEVYLERPERRSIAGNIYKGVVDNVLPGMEAAFVEIGLEKNGFLFVDEIVGPELEGRRPRGRRITDLISRGEEVLVQAVKDPMKTKGARLTTEISLPGRFVVYVPNGEGPRRLAPARGRRAHPPARTSSRTSPRSRAA